ncbi:electron transfer flavoprotein [Candidatus Geothermarchaeota archaeon ex4572_27]|nr:MAG: electron transfer flavoprotein [Candidatus Geothermarchaeota archaeon ex4572_27]
MERFDVIVVGGGPSGLSTAYFLAKRGFEVVVLERGSDVGSKTVFGGRVYAYPLDKYIPEYRRELEVERWITRERLSLVHGDEMVTIEYAPSKKGSFTIFLPSLLTWLAGKVEEQGGIVATGVRVDSIIFEDGRATGVLAGDDKIYGDYVVVAEGSNGVLLERHGLRRRPRPEEMALGIKEVVKLDQRTINERLGLGDDEGIAWFFIGDFLGESLGGAFLYTMKDHIALGVVLRLSCVDVLRDNSHMLVERFRLKPQIQRLVKGGTIVEYLAKTVREWGFEDVLRKPYGNGYLVVGEAAGLTVNTGFTVRGVDFAIESGKLAADAIEHAHSIGSSDSEALSRYAELLRRSHIMRTVRKYWGARNLLDRPDVYLRYPALACGLLRGLYTVEEEPLRLSEALKAAARESGISTLKLLLDVVRGYRHL